MHYLFWIVTFLVVVVFATFTVANLQVVTLDFWPFEYQLSLPFAPLVLGCLLVGLLVGAFLMWLRFGAARARARRAEQRAKVLERELVEIKRSATAPRAAATRPTGGGAAQLTHRDAGGSDAGGRDGGLGGDGLKTASGGH